MKLTGKQREQLKKALLSAFSEKQLEIMLEEELDWVLAEIVSKNDYTTVVFDVIKYTESKGKLIELLKAAKMRNPGNPELRRIPDDFNTNAIAEDEINEIKSILNKMEFNIVKYSYLQILPENVKKDNIDLCNPKNENCIIKFLSEDYTKTGEGVPSLIKLAEEIVNNIDNNQILYKKLMDWLNRLASRLHINICCNSDSKNKSEQVDTDSRLIFIVYPTSEGFRLEAICDENGNKESLDYLTNANSWQEKGVSCSSTEKIYEKLNNIISDIIKGYLQNIKHDNCLEIIEIYLPCQHIYTDINNFYIKNDDNDDVLLLKKFQVILHSSERITKPIMLNSLKKKWKILQDVIKEESHLNIHEKVETVKTNKLNWTQIENNLEDKIGIKLTKNISETQSQQKIIKTILNDGTPFAFWLRCSHSPNIKLEQIDCYLTSESLKNDLHKLIKNVYEMRREAYRSTNPKKDLGYHLGFLCDIPDKINKIKPPPYQLKS